MIKPIQDLEVLDKESGLGEINQTIINNYRLLTGLVLDDIMSLMFDESSAAESKTLTGHSGPIFGVSFSPDKNFLVSGSEDATG